MERRRRGEPIVAVSASQGVISGFLRRGGGGGSKMVDDENERTAGGVLPKPGGRVGDQNERNAGDVSKGPSGKVGDGNEGTAGGIPKEPGGRAGDGDARNAGGPAKDRPRDRDRVAGHSDKPEPPRASGLGQDDGTELDDLFLSASQLAREVESMPPPPMRKRSRDEAFPGPEPPPQKPASRAAADQAADPDLEAYDLGISSQELLQLEVQEPVPGKHSSRLSPPPEPRVELPELPDPPDPPGDPGISSTQQSFELCSQELREIDALVADVPLETKHPATDSNTTPRPNGNEQDTAGTMSEGDIAKEASEPRHVPAPHATTNAHPTATDQHATEPPDEDAEAPQPFFTSCTQELTSLAEKRSRATASAEALRRKRAAALPDPTHDGGAGRSKAAPKGEDDGEAPRAERRREAAREHPPGGPLSGADLDDDDDAFWEDLDETDLEALLA